MFENLTMGEIAKAESIAGKSIRLLADDKEPNAVLMAAVAYVIALRSEPDLKFPEFSNTKTLTDIMEILGMGGEDEKK